jgi:hypothetical protein
MAQLTARPIAPLRARQRKGLFSVPCMAARRALTAYVISRGTTPPWKWVVSLLSKEIRKAAQQAPHRRHGFCRGIAVPSERRGGGAGVMSAAEFRWLPATRQHCLRAKPIRNDCRLKPLQVKVIPPGKQPVSRPAAFYTGRAARAAFQQSCFDQADGLAITRPRFGG